VWKKLKIGGAYQLIAPSLFKPFNPSLQDFIFIKAFSFYKMRSPQYIRTPFNPINVVLGLTYQICQINYHDEHVVEVDWNPRNNRPVVHLHEEWFELHSPDVEDMTMRHVLDDLQYSNEDMVLTYPDLNIENYLDTPIAEVQVGQMDIFPAGQAPSAPAEPPIGQPQQVLEYEDPPEDHPTEADIQLIASLFGLGRVYR
jgi:hypothetical protein